MPLMKIWDSMLEKALRARRPSPSLLPPPPPPPALYPPPPPSGRWSNFRSDASADIYSKTVKLFSGAVFCTLGFVASRLSSTDLAEEIAEKVKSTKLYRTLFPFKKVVASVPQSIVVDILVLQAVASTGPFSKNSVKDAHSFLWGVPGGIYTEVSEALKRKKENETAK